MPAFQMWHFVNRALYKTVKMVMNKGGPSTSNAPLIIFAPRAPGAPLSKENMILSNKRYGASCLKPGLEILIPIAG